MKSPPGSIRETRCEIGNRVHVIITGPDPDAVWTHALKAKNAYGIAHAPRLFGLEKSFGGMWYCVLVEQERAA